MNTHSPPLPDLPDTFRWVRRPWGRGLECVPLSDLAPHGWTTRDLDLDGDAARCTPGWQALAHGEGLTCARLASVTQVHGARIVSAAQTGAEADALADADPGWLLTVRVADCVPLLVADRRTGAVAAAHAGWRGTAARIAAAAVRHLGAAFGSAPEDLVAAIGPAIRACCYEVGPELVDAFRAAGASDGDLTAWFAAQSGSRRLYLDVARANRDQLAAAGVPRTQILDSGLCTACHPHVFHSYRRDKARAGRMVGYIRRR